MSGGSTGRVVAGGSSGGGAGVLPNGGAAPLVGLRSGVALPVHDHETLSTGGELDAYLPADTAIPPTTVLTSADSSVAIVEEPPGTFDLQAVATSGVSSVNGETGVVTLDAADVGALTEAAGDAAYAATDHTHPSQQTAPWRFQNPTTIADPGDGNFRSNTGVLATATSLALSRTTQDGYDTPASGYGVVAGDTIYIQDRDDNTKWVRMLVMDPLVRFPTYVTSSVTVIGSAGTITDSQICQLTFTLAGGGGGVDYLTQDEGDARYEPLDSAYTKAEGDARYATPAGVATAVTTHEGLANPHAVYALDTDLSTHAAAADPHPTYQTQTEGDARYLQLSGGTVSGAVTGLWNVGAAPSGAPKITVQSGEPSSPATGDLWVW